MRIQNAQTLWVSLCMMTMLVVTAQPQTPTPAPTPSPQPVSIRERHDGLLSLKAARTLTVAVDNRTTGRIVVKGWERDIIEAHASSQRGEEVMDVEQSGNSTSARIFIKADYADLDPGSTRTNWIGNPPTVEGRPIRVDLEVKLPRSAEIEQIQVMSSEVEVSGMETRIAVSGRWSTVTLKTIKSAVVQNRNGNIEVDEANGLLEVSTTSGAIRINNAKGAVRAVSISGPIEIKCSSGRVDVANTVGLVDLLNVDGDVDALATNSNLTFTGPLSEGGSYHLKSMSGKVEMVLPSNTKGFNVVLSSYRMGGVETNFSLSNKQTSGSDSFNRRMMGRFGNGRAQIALDSFDGQVRLTRVAPESMTRCQ